jgi:hypothetical protein
VAWRLYTFDHSHGRANDKQSAISTQHSAFGGQHEMKRAEAAPPPTFFAFASR